MKDFCLRIMVLPLLVDEIICRKFFKFFRFLIGSELNISDFSALTFQDFFLNLNLGLSGSAISLFTVVLSAGFLYLGAGLFQLLADFLRLLFGVNILLFIELRGGLEWSFWLLVKAIIVFL